MTISDATLYYIILGVFIEMIFYYKERKIWCANTLHTYRVVSPEVVELICFLSYFLDVTLWPIELYKRLCDGLHFQIGRTSITFGFVKTTFGLGFSFSFSHCPKFMFQGIVGLLFMHVQYLTKENVEVLNRLASMSSIRTNEEASEIFSENFKELKDEKENEK